MKSYTRASGSFVLDGFKRGNVLDIHNIPGAFAYSKVLSVSASALTVRRARWIEAAIARIWRIIRIAWAHRRECLMRWLTTDDRQ